MSTKYKLTYFDFYCRAEAARMVFALAGVEFEDHRLSVEYYEKNWKELKEKTPFGQIPLLEFDGKVFCQSVAITRYLANKFGCAGKTELERLQADMIVDCIVEATNPLNAIYHEENKEKQAELAKNFEEKLRIHLSYLEKFLDGNTTGSGFFCWRFDYLGGSNLGSPGHLDLLHEVRSSGGIVSQALSSQRKSGSQSSHC